MPVDTNRVYKVGQIDMPACHTIYEFLNRINSLINDVMLQGEYKNQTPNTIVALANYTNVDSEHLLPKIAEDVPDVKEEDGSHLRFNTYSADNFGQADEDPIAHFKIEMGPDYRFSVVLNHHFSRTYYIKLHPELFNMLQFREKFTDLTTWDRTYLTGRRFMGERLGAIDRDDVCQKITETMEGGEKAFRDRKDKYGY